MELKSSDSRVTEPDKEVALAMARDYADELLEPDIDNLDGIRRNKAWMRSIMRSYARNAASESALTTLAT